MIPLFEAYPSLKEALPFAALGNYPTPVVSGSALDANRQCAGITIKHDGVSGRPYGGNKVRKLEFLLGEAKAKGRKELLTFGGAGSNHALATAIYGQKLGLKTHSLLIKQSNSHSVQHNLLRSMETGARLQHFESIPAMVAGTALKTAANLCRGKSQPYVIPPGGTSALGLLGYVNAAFELNAQVARGELELPDVVYIPCGTLGSSVGLALGFALLELRTKVCAVAVTDTRFSSTAKARKLFRKANSLLRELDKGIPEVRFEDSNFALRHDFFGGEYGIYTQAGVAAVHQVKDDVGLSLEGCYTGKCAAALLDDLRLGRLEGQQVVFWNTYDAHGAAHSLHGLDYRRLPRAFHRYFERDVQAFDRG